MFLPRFLWWHNQQAVWGLWTVLSITENQLRAWCHRARSELVYSQREPLCVTKVTFPSIRIRQKWLFQAFAFDKSDFSKHSHSTETNINYSTNFKYAKNVRSLNVVEFELRTSLLRLTLCGHIKTAEQQPIIQQCGDSYTGCWWVGCYIWYSEEGPGWLAHHLTRKSVSEMTYIMSRGGAKPYCTIPYVCRCL